MKFLLKNNLEPIIFNYEYFFLYEVSFDYYFFDFEKNFKKSRKLNNLFKKGVIKNLKNFSKINDKNYLLHQKFIKLNFREGKSFHVYNNLNRVNLNFYNYLGDFDQNLPNNYKNSQYFYNLINNDYAKLDFNYLITHFLIDLESIFEIKSKKNNKKKLNNSKYIYEISYIKKNKRIKYLLKSLSLFSNFFKKYEFYERIFWSLFISILNKNNSFLSKKKSFIYLKSIKFFKKMKK